MNASLHFVKSPILKPRSIISAAFFLHSKIPAVHSVTKTVTVTGTMSTIRNIAARSNVSIATVSRALNNHPEINDETRDRVLKAANEVGYFSAVGRRSTTNVGFVLAGNIPFSTYDAHLMRGILTGLGEQRFDVTVINLDRDLAEGETFTQFFARKGIRGAIIRTIDRSRQVCQAIADEGLISVVVAERFEDSKKVNFICCDTRDESRRAVEHLIHLGHKRIGFAMLIDRDRDHLDRYDGYRQALLAAGLPYDDALVVRVVADLSGGAAAINRLMALPTPPTALFAANPLLSVGAVCRVQAIGLRIPDDISIVGFDDLDARFGVFPVMSAVCQNVTRMGLEAGLWLGRRLSKQTTAPLREIIPSVFEVNQTTGVPLVKPFRVLPDGTRVPV